MNQNAPYTDAEMAHNTLTRIAKLMRDELRDPWCPDANREKAWMHRQPLVQRSLQAVMRTKWIDTEIVNELRKIIAVAVVRAVCIIDVWIQIGSKEENDGIGVAFAANSLNKTISELIEIVNSSDNLLEDLRAYLEKEIKESWGPRCTTKDV